MDNFQVRMKTTGAGVVDRPGCPLFQHCQDGYARIFDKQPVSLLTSISVDGQVVTLQGGTDHEWDQFLGELKWAEIVGTADNEHADIVRALISKTKQVRGRLAGSVGAAGPQWTILG